MRIISRICFNVLLLSVLAACNIAPSLKPVSETPGSPELPAKPDCDQAEMVSETIPAGTEFLAGQVFEKAWTLRNISPCEWNDQFAVVYYDGVGMGGPTHALFTGVLPAGTSIPSGDEVTVSLKLRAPYAPGDQVGEWKLRDPSGNLFMPSNVSQQSLMVSIRVVGSIYNFASNVCAAEWTEDGLPLACDGIVGEDEMGVRLVPFPRPEEELLQNVPAISIDLPDNEGVNISGIYPVMVINPGDHLHFQTACQQDLPDCDLRFEVSILVDTIPHQLGTWNEVSDGIMTVVDLDLTSWSGERVQLVFTVTGNGRTAENRGYWLLPVILSY